MNGSYRTDPRPPIGIHVAGSSRPGGQTAQRSLVRRGCIVAVAGAAIGAAALAGCSSIKSLTTDGSPGAAAPGGASHSQTRVIIDGQDQDQQGNPVMCRPSTGPIITANGRMGSATYFLISIGAGVTGTVVKLSVDNPPKVMEVKLPYVNGDEELDVDSASNQSNASVTKDGDSYKITGTAQGLDTSNNTMDLLKPFEIDVTCS